MAQEHERLQSSDEEPKKKRRKFGSIFQRSENCFEASYKLDGERYNFSTATYEEAEIRLDKIYADHRLGMHVVGAKMKLKHWISFWLSTYAKGNIKASTYSSYAQMAENHVYPALGDVTLDRLTVSRLQAFFNEKKEGGRADGKKGGLSKKTLNNIRIMLNGCLNQAVTDGKIPVNPISGIKLGKPSKTEMRVLSKAEQEALERIVEASLKVTGLGIIIVLYLGVRLGELLGLVWENVHLDAKTPHVDINQQLTRQNKDAPLDEGAWIVRISDRTRLVVGPLKTDKAYRRLYLPDFVVGMFQRIRDWQAEERGQFGPEYNPHGFVFCTELGDVFDPRTYQEVFYKMVRAADIPRANFHSLRHTYATRCVQKGIDPATLSKLLGHALISFTLDTYVHAEDDEMLKASASFSRMG